jgi:asparagine synthase (glutamine-hydrolysing)
MWSHFSRLPAAMRKVVGSSIAKVPPAGWDALVQLLPGGSQQPAHFGARVQHTFRTLGDAASLDDLFSKFLTVWSSEANPVLGPSDVSDGPAFDLDLGRVAPAPIRMMYCDATSFLPDDILCKVDRASMAVSLETRAPFLDHRVAEVAARIPLRMKVRRNRGKMILRRLLHREAPAALFDRAKAGFVVPVGEWMRGELRPWAEALLDERRLKQQSYFDATAIRSVWDSHLAGRVDAKSQLWPVLMFQAWLDDQDRPMERRQRSA